VRAQGALPDTGPVGGAWIDSAAVTQRVRLGEITCPSGELVVIDGGYLGVWSGDRSPAAIDPAALGIDDPATANDIRGAVDFDIDGPDAAAAARLLLGRKPGLSLYDVPASAAADFQAAFAALCQDDGLNATLRDTGRVSHRERARRCAAGGSFLAFGVPVVAIGGLPRDRPLWVEATEYGSDAGGRWASIEVVVGDGTVASSPRLGEVGVDWARLAFGDADAIGSWVHEDPIDGLADVVFWGRSEAEAASVHDAPMLDIAGEAGVYGWTDLSLPAAIDKARAVIEWAESDVDRKLMVDFRPHSHHWQVMRQVRASETGSGMVEIGGARVLFAQTSWGDGLFPVHADRDAAGELVAIRVAFPAS
jgi:hypothetical protein